MALNDDIVIYAEYYSVWKNYGFNMKNIYTKEIPSKCE